MTGIARKAGRPPGPAVAAALPVDELINEEHRHLVEAVSLAEEGGASVVGDRALAHAKEQVDRIEIIKGYEKLLVQGSAFKTYLLSMATHDLKGPLTALALHVHGLIEHPGSEEERQQSLQVMRRSLRRMTIMMDGFLELARVQAGRLTITPGPVDVEALVREVAETFGESAKSSSLRLEAFCPRGLEAWGDQTRIAQVLSNLVGNAIRYSPPGGRIRVEANETPDHVQVSVSDQGIGLTADQLSRLFQPFVQVQGIPSESEGVGLGLYLSQALVEAHGGRLWLESPGPARGTTATFTLPRQPPGRPAVDGARQATAAAGVGPASPSHSPLPLP